MALKLVLAVLLVLSAWGYTEQNDVLILTDADFPDVINQFEFVLIEFYAPWCGHCKKLTPIYDEVAAELKAADSPVRLAKIDADAYSSVKGTYGVQGFPTLIFFSGGTQIQFNGQRNKQFMLNWLLKKTRDPVVALQASNIESVQKDGKVNIVFYGDLSSTEGTIVSNIAKGDDFNNYYNVKEATDANPEGSIEIHRPFGGVVVYEKADSSLKPWIALHERPTISPFDDRTIGDVFQDKKNGIFFFAATSSGDEAVKAFSEVATQFKLNRKKRYVFSIIDEGNEHYSGLASYIKIDPTKIPVIYIDGPSRQKCILEANPSELTVESLTQFLEDVEGKKVKQYKLDEQVKVDIAAEEL